MSASKKVLGLALTWIGDMAATSVTAIHAGYAGNNATLAFPGPITQPTQPRCLTVTFAGAWDGGTVTITGLDINAKVITETFTPGAGTTVTGTKLFASVTSAAKSLVGASATTASIGNGRITSVPSNIDNFSLVGYQFSWPATNSPVGVISFEVSNDYDPARPDSGTWKAVAAPGSMSQPAGTASGDLCSLQNIPWDWIRVIYTQTSGGASAVLSAWISIKKTS